MANTHIDFGVSKDCVNPDSYGEICVKCNCCGRFGKETMWIRRYNMYWRNLAELIEKHSDDFYFTDLQQTNIAIDIVTYGQYILECVKHLDFDNTKPDVEGTWTMRSYCLEQEIERLKGDLQKYEQKSTREV